MVYSTGADAKCGWARHRLLLLAHWAHLQGWHASSGCWWRSVFDASVRAVASWLPVVPSAAGLAAVTVEVVARAAALNLQWVGQEDGGHAMRDEKCESEQGVQP